MTRGGQERSDRGIKQGFKLRNVPLLSRTAHDRGHLSRALDDPAQGRPVRVLRVDEKRTVPVREGAAGP